MDLSHKAGTALKEHTRIDPGSAGDNGAEFEERGTVGPVKLLQNGRRHAEAGTGELVGVASERVDQFDE